MKILRLIFAPFHQELVSPVVKTKRIIESSSLCRAVTLQTATYVHRMICEQTERPVEVYDSTIATK